MYAKLNREDINRFINDKELQQNAKTYFPDHQPHIFQTGYYSAPSWNWSYQVGITSIARTKQDAKDFGDVQYFEVVTQFGEVKAARKINLSAYN